jgi:hypothetical protein
MILFCGVVTIQGTYFKIRILPSAAICQLSTRPLGLLLERNFGPKSNFISQNIFNFSKFASRIQTKTLLEDSLVSKDIICKSGFDIVNVCKMLSMSKNTLVPGLWDSKIVR